MKSCLGYLALGFGICAAAVFLMCMALDRQAAILVGIPSLVITGLLFYFSAKLLHRTPPPPLTREERQQIRDAEKRRLEERIASGELVHVSFTVTRAVAVADYEDEGLHLFLDVGEDRSLQFCSQDLYDVAAGQIDEEINDLDLAYPRTQLSVYRNQRNEYEHDLEWSGVVVQCKLAKRDVWESWPRGPINNPQGWGEFAELSFDEVLALADRYGYHDPEYY